MFVIVCTVPYVHILSLGMIALDSRDQQRLSGFES